MSRGATLPLVLLGDRGTWGLTGGGAAPKAAAPEALALLALVDVLEPGTEGDRTAVAAACGAQLDTSFGQARGPPSC